VRTTPIVLLARRNVRLWSSLTGTLDPVNLSGGAQRAAEYLATHGASFFDEISAGTGLLPSQAEDALAELVALGLINSDSFAGLRALLVPSERRKPAMAGRRRRRIALFGMDAAGRWARIARAAPGAEASRELSEETIEHVVRTLLRRWGVVFWRLLAREAQWLPPWRDLLQVLRRLEARGEIRGGRFVASEGAGALLLRLAQPSDKLRVHAVSEGLPYRNKHKARKAAEELVETGRTKNGAPINIMKTAQYNWFSEIESELHRTHNLTAPPALPYCGEAFTASAAWNTVRAATMLARSGGQLLQPVPGGIGLAERLYDRHAALIAGATDLIAGCACDAGCPACTGPRLEPDIDAKALALRLLGQLAGGPGTPNPSGEGLPVLEDVAP
jgi:hypothetical protein